MAVLTPMNSNRGGGPVLCTCLSTSRNSCYFVLFHVSFTQPQNWGECTHVFPNPWSAYCPAGASGSQCSIPGLWMLLLIGWTVSRYRGNVWCTWDWNWSTAKLCTSFHQQPCQRRPGMDQNGVVCNRSHKMGLPKRLSLRELQIKSFQSIHRVHQRWFRTFQFIQNTWTRRCSAFYKSNNRSGWRFVHVYTTPLVPSRCGKFILYAHTYARTLHEIGWWARSTVGGGSWWCVILRLNMSFQRDKYSSTKWINHLTMYDRVEWNKTDLHTPPVSLH